MAKRLITCRELIGLLSQYSDGELLPRQRIWADEHIARCEKCAGYLRGYERTTLLIKESVDGPDVSREEKLPEDLIKRILATYRDTAE
jgi:anti-sigma factor RsiW